MNERSIFLEALEIPDPAERAVFLEKVCGGDPAVRRGVEDLLSAQARSGSFMPIPPVPQTTSDDTPREGPGNRVGPYKLLQQIGEGGMGTVFMAEQEEPVRRMVALKIIREGMDSKGVLARFEAERQALALMDHPNIAKVLDAGTTASGRPYFVMELVKGTPITKFCDEHQLTLRERLELFVPVCQAIQHAHQKGIIHRDVKPSNVLVAEYDDRPVPKVIDFGVAKATSQKLTERTLFTAFGTVVGTLEYMSPEQAKLNQLDVDTRSDVYGLGVLLYELLTGTTPLERKRLRAAALDEVLRLIREEEVVRPSTRLSTAETRPAIAAARRAGPGQLGKVLRGELDWIVMKALEKDRTRRYETASGFARDVERYLKNEPVEACPPTLGYRLRKAYQKNRAAVVVAASFLLLLAVATVVSTTLALQARRAERAAVAERVRAEEGEAEANEQREQAIRERERAEREQRRAEEEKRSAQAVRDFLRNDLLSQASLIEQAEARQATGGDFAVAPNPTVNELLDRAAAQLTPEKLEARFPNLPFVQAEVLRTVGITYVDLHQLQKGHDLLARAVAMYGKARSPEDPAALHARYRLAKTRFWLGRFDEAKAQLESVRDDMTRVLGPHAWDTFEADIRIGEVYERMNRPADAIAHCRRILAQVRSHDGPDTQKKIGWVTFFLGAALRQANRHEEAVRELELCWGKLQLVKVRLDHPDVQSVVKELARAYRGANRVKDAFALLERALKTLEDSNGPLSQATWRLRHELAWTHLQHGDKAVAIELFERNVAAAGTPPAEAMTFENLHSAYLGQGRVEDALTRVRQALDVQVKRHGPDHRSWRTGKYRAQIGLALHRQKKYAEAEPFLLRGSQEMVEHAGQRPGWDKNEIPATDKAIVALYQATNRPAEARKWIDNRLLSQAQDLQRLRTASAKDTPASFKAITALAQAYVDAGRKEEAVKLFEETCARLKANGWPLDESSLGSLTALRLAVRRAGRFDLAAGMSAAIVAAFRKLPDPPKEPFTRELMALGAELTLAKRPSEAEPHLREALQIWKGHDPNAWQATEAKQGLARALLRQRKHAEAEPLLLEVYEESVERIAKAPPWQKHFPATAADRLVELYTAVGKPDEVKKWQAERAKHVTPAAKPQEKK